MTSEERHEARYQRRKALRTKKRRAFISQYDNFSLVYGLENLHKSAKECYKGVIWKPSTQRYMKDELYHISVARQKLMNGENVHLPFNCFSVCERGKKRDIKAIHISERVIQKSLCRNVLLPMISHFLIYDNGACQKDKGTSFAFKRCIKHLSDYARRNGREGYVLQFDIKSYFDSIPLAKLNDCLVNGLNDEGLKKFIWDCLKVFGDVGIGLGSEISQISAIAYLNPLDHYITNQRHFGYYGRYMDDGYVIAKNKGDLVDLLEGMKAIVAKLGLRFNEKKTHITRLCDGFVFLKTRLFISKTNKIVRIPAYSSVIRERRKLKRLMKLDGIEYKEIEWGFISWLGSIKSKDSYHIVSKMLKFMYDNFQRRINYNGRTKETNAIRTSQGLL